MRWARRIGKSTVAEEFAKNEDVSDLNYIFLQLQLQYKTDLIERKSLIIFDEVQLCPLARQTIKSLVKDGRYDFVETDSLISM